MVQMLSLRDAAVRVLQQAGEPLHYREITKRAIESGLASSDSQTPAASMNAVIAVDIKGNGAASEFVRVKPGVFALRSVAPAPEMQPAGDGDRRVRIPYFPVYSEVRAVLPIWEGQPASAVTKLRTTISGLFGTPQQPLDWTDPDRWIPERLAGDDRKLAEAIWTRSAGKVNPRHVYGHWLLVRNYGLLKEEESGVLRLTESGRDFLEHPGGTAEATIDEEEGVIKVLTIVAESGPAAPSELFEEWGEYLKRRSGFGTDSTIKDTLRWRLRNALERALLARSGTLYSITEAGLAYLHRTGDEDAPGSAENAQLYSLVRKQEASVRASIRELLLELDPIAFEHLIKLLLEEMEYSNVEVTSPSNDAGVDVVADIELGISSVREVVQAKRHKRTIQRKDLDALRGCLHRFGAVRGTIITTANFSKGTREAAFEVGAAPITLIDGDKLINMLIQHGIGVRKKNVEILELDADAFAHVGPSAVGTEET